MGNNGLQNGWALNDSGNVDFPHSLKSSIPLMQTAGARWVRIDFRLGAYYKDWTTPGANGLTALQCYDAVVDAALAAGLRVLGIIGNEACPGSQSDWCTNNVENNSASTGDNPYIQALSQAAVLIAGHFAGKVASYEIWNEPNAWSTHPSPNVYAGSSFIYPSNFVQLLHRIYNETRNAGLSDLSFVSGGLFGHDLGGTLDDMSGANYLRQVYSMGFKYANWQYDIDVWGQTPFDAIGQHLYIDQGRLTSGSTITAYLNAVRQVYTSNESGHGPKPTIITEFGWSTTSVSPADQATNIQTAYSTFRTTSFVKNSYYFQVTDIPEANHFYGLYDGGGQPKLSFAAYQQHANF